MDTAACSPPGGGRVNVIGRATLKARPRDRNHRKVMDGGEAIGDSAPRMSAAGLAAFDRAQNLIDPVARQLALALRAGNEQPPARADHLQIN